MAEASTSGNMSPKLLEVAKRAKQEPKARFHSLAHLLDVPALERAYKRLRPDAAVGVDGITKDEYGEELLGNLQRLHARLKAGQYRHQPIRRVHIPKDGGTTRALGISTTEDKIVQGAVREVLEAVFEQEFLPCSYGFRPKRSAHDAVRAMDAAVRAGWVNWILEADIRSFFDSIDRTMLLKMLQVRVPDGTLKRLVGKCLHVGVLDGGEFTRPEDGTAQGSVISPLLGNLYLHYALDLWFERCVKPRMHGRAELIRYADDFVILFEHKSDADRVLAVLHKRMEKFRLTLHPDKTRLLFFRRPPRNQLGGKGPSTFDFLGFTFYWRLSRNGGWFLMCRTRSARFRRTVQAIYDYCRDHRHLSVSEQHEALTRRIRGHFNYFGVNGNLDALKRLLHRAKLAWGKWLRRRGDRNRLTWESFWRMLERFPFPPVRVYTRIW